MSGSSWWYYAEQQTTYGPLSLEHLVALIEARTLPPTVLVWRPGFSDWVPASAISEIAELLPPPLPTDSNEGLEPDESSLDESDPLYQVALGEVRAALRPNHISVEEVRDSLRVVVELGFNPLELYQRALEERPPEYEEPPLLEEVLPKERPKGPPPH
jgi:hypothetical protein